MTIRVQSEDFDIAHELAEMTRGRPEVGAQANFIGLVRGSSANDTQSTMTLEYYPGMTERQLEAIEDEARHRWELDSVLIIHRIGRLQVGERIMLCAVTSKHRRAAFEACEFLMDWLKTKAPFWKLEETDGQESWVAARASDDAAAARWGKVKN